MKMKFSRHIFGILILVLLVGCLKYPDDQNEATQMANFHQEIKLPSPDVHISPTTMAMSPTQDPSNTSTPLTTTLEVKKSPTPQSNKFHVQDHCPSVDVGIDQISGLSGTLVFSADNTLSKEILLSPKQGENSQVIFWNPQSDQISSYDLEESENQYYFAESPNKEKLAFMEGKQLPMALDLIVVNNRGEESGRIVVPDDWTFFNWLNNEQLLLRQFRHLGDTSRKLFDLIAVNTFDKHQQVLSSDLPNIYLREEYWDWGSTTLFNTDATLVLYPEYQLEPSGLYSILWSLEENKEVARIAGGGMAKWAPNGSLLLLAVDLGKDYSEDHDEIFLITASGELSQVTFFFEYYQENDDYSFTLPSWSPDNDKIAFWIITQAPVETAQLAVLDLETSIVDLFCKKINPYPDHFASGFNSSLGYYVEVQMNSANPIWSPDSRYLLIEDEGDTLLFDTHIFTVSKIAENARPVGWLK